MRRLIGLGVAAMGCGPLVPVDADSSGDGSSGPSASLDGNELADDGIPPDPSSPGDPSVDPDPSADDGSSVSVGDSTTDAPSTTCGDGILDADEACDDGDLSDGDGCSSTCTFESAPLWSASYDGPASSLDVFEDVVIAPDGMIYAVGTHRVVDGDADVLLQQYGPDGSVGWMLSYAGPDALDDDGAALVWTPDEQLAVVGSTESMASGDDVLVLTVDAGTGLLSWARSFDGTSSGPGEYDDRDRGSDIVVDAVGNLVIAGTVRGEIEGDDAWVAGLERSGGTLTWSLQIDFAKYDQTRAVASGPSGGVALLVEHDPDHASRTAVVSSAGELLDASVEHPFAARDLSPRVDSGFVLAGVADSGSGRELVVATLDGSLAAQWQVDEHAASDAEVIAVASGPSGEVAVVGSRSSLGQQSNAWVRTNASDGGPWWSDLYDGSASLHDVFRGAAFDWDGSLVVVGSETVLGEQTNAIIRRYPAFSF